MLNLLMKVDSTSLNFILSGSSGWLAASDDDSSLVANITKLWIFAWAKSMACTGSSNVSNRAWTQQVMAGNQGHMNT